MGMFNEVKCARCDRRYSGLRSRCPYCGARRIGRGKYSGSSGDQTGKMLITILIMIVLVAAVVVLLVSSRDSVDPAADAADSTPPTSNIPGDSETTSYTASPSNTAESTPPDDEPSDEPSPVVIIESLTITYSGVKTTDFTMKTTDPQLPLKVKIEPADIEITEKIEWTSSNTDVFEVVAADTTGIAVKVTAIGVGDAKLTVKIGDVSTTCDVRVRKG